MKTIFKNFFAAIQDHLELLVMANVGWFALVAPFILLEVYSFYFAKGNILTAVLSLAAFLVIPAATAALFYLVRTMLTEPDAGFKDFIAGLKKYFLKSLWLCLLDILLMVILAVNLVFYLKLFPGLSGPFKYFILVILGLVIWFLLFLLLSQIYLFPVLVARDVSIFAVFKTAFILVLNNLWLNVIILGALALMTVVWIISGLGILCFLASTAAILETVTLQELTKET